MCDADECEVDLVCNSDDVCADGVMTGASCNATGKQHTAALQQMLMSHWQSIQQSPTVLISSETNVEGQQLKMLAPFGIPDFNTSAHFAAPLHNLILGFRV